MVNISDCFTGEIIRAVGRHRPDSIRIVEPGEWRVKTAIDGWAERCKISVDVRADDRFVCGILEFQTWAQARNELMMEFFYRDMRRKTGLLISVDGKPEGGQWNLDKMNRAPPKRGLNYPELMHFAPDETAEVMTLVAGRWSLVAGRGSLADCREVRGAQRGRGGHRIVSCRCEVRAGVHRPPCRRRKASRR